MTDKLVYLDHNATTPLHPEVMQTLKEAMEIFGNPSSMHSFGRIARQQVEQARANVASLLGALPEEIVFVGSGSEGNNTVLSILSCPSKCCAYGEIHGPDIVTTAIEHPCVLDTTRCLQDRGAHVAFIGVDQYGKINFDALDKALTKKIGVVSVMTANNEIGTLQDIKRIAALCHERGALFHTDAVQAFGKIPMNVRDLDIDFLTLSGHKIYGPKGIGALYVRRKAPFLPLIHGGHQERGLRGGTESVPLIVGIGKAAEIARKYLPGYHAKVRLLRDWLERGILDSIPDTELNGHPTQRLSNTTNITFRGLESEALLLLLDQEGICASTGSACLADSDEPSHVLQAMKPDGNSLRQMIRFSLGLSNENSEVQESVALVRKCVAMLAS